MGYNDIGDCNPPDFFVDTRMWCSQVVNFLALRKSFEETLMVIKVIPSQGIVTRGSVFKQIMGCYVAVQGDPNHLKFNLIITFMFTFVFSVMRLVSCWISCTSYLEFISNLETNCLTKNCPSFLNKSRYKILRTYQKNLAQNKLAVEFNAMRDIKGKKDGFFCKIFKKFKSMRKKLKLYLITALLAFV